MELNKGMQAMISSVIKMLGLDPNKVQGAMDQIAKSLHNASIELQTIRRQQDYLLSQNRAIMRHLGVENDGQSIEHRDGSALNGGGDGSAAADAPATGKP